MAKKHPPKPKGNDESKEPGMKTPSWMTKKNGDDKKPHEKKPKKK